MKKTTFALYFGNRGFFPGELVAAAREKMVKVCEENGYGYLIMDESLTRYGAIETRDEGKLYHDWLKSHEGEYDGVILCMPIFVDENGAINTSQAGSGTGCGILASAKNPNIIVAGAKSNENELKFKAVIAMVALVAKIDTRIASKIHSANLLVLDSSFDGFGLDFCISVNTITPNVANALNHSEMSNTEWGERITITDTDIISEVILSDFAERR